MLHWLVPSTEEAGDDATKVIWIVEEMGTTPASMVLALVNIAWDPAGITIDSSISAALDASCFVKQPVRPSSDIESGQDERANKRITRSSISKTGKKAKLLRSSRRRR